VCVCVCVCPYLDDLGHGLLEEGLRSLLEPVAEATVEVVGKVDRDEDARGGRVAVCVRVCVCVCVMVRW
jgi:hypothetical protein